MKKILCIISKDIIRRNIYDTDFWSNLVTEHKDDEFHLLTMDGDNPDIKKLAEYPNVSLHEIKKHSHYGFTKLIFFLVRTGVNSHSTRTYRMRAYKLGQIGAFSTFLKEFIAKTFANFSLYQKFVRFLVLKFMKISDEMTKLFDDIKPDLVFAPSLIDNGLDAPASVCAKRRGIRVVGMVRSWDNLNNHGILAFIPDRFIVQNTWLIEAAKKFQGIGKDKIHDVIGLPHYDFYFDIRNNPENYVKPKEEFFAEMGLDPNKKLLLLGGSDFYYTEDKLPETIDRLIESGEITEPTQVLFRPHPRSLFSREEYNIDNLKHIVLDGGKSGKTGFSDGDKLINLFHYSDIIINIASTLAIDASVFKTPTICINYDEPEDKVNYWTSVHRLHDTFDHYEKLISTGGARSPKSVEDLKNDINEYLADPSLDADGRQRILDAFVEPFDGKAGMRLKDIVSAEIVSAKA